MNKKGFSAILVLTLVVVTVTVFVLYTIHSSKKSTAQFFSTQKLAYSSNGMARVYDFSSNNQLDLKILSVTSFLWSHNGKELALMVQGEYDPGKLTFIPIKRVYATTAGFNYMVYLVDLETGITTLLLDKVFGKVRWSKDTTGLYFTEQYRQGRPLILGNQSGLPPDQEEYFFISLDGEKRKTTKKEFDETSYFNTASSLNSPDGKLIIELSDNIVGDKQMKIKDQNNNIVVELTGQLPVWAPIL